MSGAPAKRQAVRELVAAGLTEAAACRALAISRSSQRYASRRLDETELIEAIKAIRTRKRRWGYKRVHTPLPGRLRGEAQTHRAHLARAELHAAAAAPEEEAPQRGHAAGRRPAPRPHNCR